MKLGQVYREKQKESLSTTLLHHWQDSRVNLGSILELNAPSFLDELLKLYSHPNTEVQIKSTMQALCDATPKISSFSSLYCIGLSHKCLKEINRSLTAVHRGFWTKYDSIIHNDAFFGGKVHPVLSSHAEVWTVFTCNLIAQILFELNGAGWWHHWRNDELTLRGKLSVYYRPPALSTRYVPV